MLATFIAIAIKEFIHFSRERSMIARGLAIQALQIALLGFIDVNAHDIPTVIVDQDQTSLSRELVGKLRATHALEIRYLTTSTEQARGHIRAGNARLAVVIPPDFARLRTAGERSHILALADGSDSGSSAQAIAAVRGVAAQLTVDVERDESGESSVRPHTMMLFNPSGKTASFTLPGLLAIVLMGEWVFSAGSAIARERERETLERLLMARLNPVGYLLGKVTPYFVGTVANGLTLVFLMHFVFGVPIQGSLILVLVANALYALTLVCMGMYFAAAADTELEVASQVNDLQFPILFLCGYIFPLSSVPTWLQPIAYALPPTHMIEVMRGVMLRGVGIADLWPSFVYLTVTPLVLIILATRRLRAKLAI